MNIIIDAERYPELFLWNGKIDALVLELWRKERNLQLPADLTEFWQITGGGVAFETEIILGPFGNSAYDEGFDEFNEEKLLMEMPNEYYIIYHGVFGLLSVRKADLKYVLIDPVNYSILGYFNDLDDWYCNTIKREYSERYKLI